AEDDTAEALVIDGAPGFAMAVQWHAEYRAWEDPVSAALFAAFRRRLRLRPATWRLVHLTLSTIIIAGTVLHAMLIEGTMGLVSKAVICALVVAALVKLLVDLQARNMLIRRKA
ncbi:MAG: hypothetical protein AAFU72_09630, partial [Pseudomonadota bacterium]